MRCVIMKSPNVLVEQVEAVHLAEFAREVGSHLRSRQKEKVVEHSLVRQGSMELFLLPHSVASVVHTSYALTRARKCANTHSVGNTHAVASWQMLIHVCPSVLHIDTIAQSPKHVYVCAHNRPNILEEWVAALQSVVRVGQEGSRARDQGRKEVFRC